MNWPSVILFGVKINIFSIPPFVTSFLTLLLGLFVYSKNKTEKQNIVYLFLCISISLWLFSASILFSSAKGDFWAKMVFVGVTFIPITSYHFIRSFLKIESQKNVIKISYLIGLFLMAALFFTNLYISGYNDFFWGHYPKAGILHPIIILLFILLYGGTLKLLYERVKSGSMGSRQKSVIVYVLVAFFIAAFATMDFIPNYGYCIYPLGYLFIFIMVLIFAYAILRHQFLDIEVIIKKTLIFGGLFTVVYAVFAFFALLGQVFFERFVTQNRWLSMVPSVLVVTIMLKPLENFLVAVTDKYLFQKKYDYKNLLRTFTSEVLTVLELDKLIQLTEDRLTDIMKLKFCKFVEIASPATFGGEARNDAALTLPIEIASGKIGQSTSAFAKASADRSGTVPIFSRDDKTIGMLLLGKKKSDEDYTQEDLDILQPLTKTLGIAISNAKLFEELAKTRAEMAQKDKMATIGTLAAGMAHEIRNPITTIRNFADYLPEKRNDSEFTANFSRIIPREIDRVENVARSLLEFSLSETDKDEEKFEAKDAIKTVLSLLEPQRKSSDIDISGECKDGCIIKANKVQVQDAMFNIMKYVLIESAKRDKIFIYIKNYNGKVCISIGNKDLCVGEHIIKDVFEPVAGLYKEKRGFGFELFIAKELIERNRGSFIITSDKIKGSEFKIEFS